MTTLRFGNGHILAQTREQSTVIAVVEHHDLTTQAEAPKEYGSLREKIAAEKAERLARYASFETLVAAAHAAGLAAGQNIRPSVMVVEQHQHVFDDNSPVTQRWVGPEGPCGFAWVKIKPATSSFARWLVKQGIASKAYQGGVQVWVRDFGQSLERKAAYAAAYAGVLNAAGFDAYAQSRMD